MKTSNSINVFEIKRVAPLTTKVKEQINSGGKAFYPISYNDSAIDIFRLSYDDREATIISIFQEGLIDLLSKHGIYKRKVGNDYQIIAEKNGVIKILAFQELHQILDNYFEQAGEYFLFRNDTLIIEGVRTLIFKEYWKRQEDNFINRNLVHKLKDHSKPLFHNSKDGVYFPFTNGVVKVTKNGIKLRKYEEIIDKCVWQEHIIKRPFIEDKGYEDSQYAKFIKNVFIKDPRLESAITTIGYLLSGYNDISSMLMVLLYDERLTLKGVPEGRTGKGIFVNAIKELRSVKRIDGQRVRFDGFSFGGIKLNTQIVWIDDVKADFNIDNLNSSLTEGLSFDVKFQNEKEFDKEANPKFILASNHILAIEGRTRIGRQHILEFGNYYSDKVTLYKKCPIRDEHGVFFSDEWEANEWNRFYTYMLKCVEHYLQVGLKDYPLIHVFDNRLKQTTNNDLYGWLLEQSLKPEQQYSTKELFEKYSADTVDTSITLRSFTNTLKKFIDTKSDMKYENQGKTNFKILGN
jgi:hypothetical protein